DLTSWKPLQRELLELLAVHSVSPAEATDRATASQWLGLLPVHGLLWAECPEAQAAFRLMQALVFYPPAALEDWGFAEEARLVHGSWDQVVPDSFRAISLWAMAKLAELLCDKDALLDALESVESNIIPPPRTKDKPLELPSCEGNLDSLPTVPLLGELLRLGPGYWESRAEAVAGPLAALLAGVAVGAHDFELDKMCHSNPENPQDKFCVFSEALKSDGDQQSVWEALASESLPEDEVVLGWGLCDVSHVQVAEQVAVNVVGASIRRSKLGITVEAALFFENQRTWQPEMKDLICSRCFESAPGANFFRISCSGSPATVTSALGGPRPWSATSVACSLPLGAEGLSADHLDINLFETTGAWQRPVALRLCRSAVPRTRSTVAVCTQPLFNLQARPHVLTDWLVYHRDVLGVDGSIDIYDIDGSAAVEGSLGVSYFPRFPKLIGSPWLASATRLTSPYVTEILQQMHCLYRHRSLGTQWVLFLHSPDEYLVSRAFGERAVSALHWALAESGRQRTSWIGLTARNFGGQDAGVELPAVSRFTKYDPDTSDHGCFAVMAHPGNVLSMHVHWARKRHPALTTWMTDNSLLRVNHYLDLFAARSSRAESRFWKEDESALWAAAHLRKDAAESQAVRVAAALAGWAGRDSSQAAIASHARARRSALQQALVFFWPPGATTPPTTTITTAIATTTTITTTRTMARASVERLWRRRSICAYTTSRRETT
ncbi:unnamed protein product, partial [Polarella glacialis]